VTRDHHMINARQCDGLTGENSVTRRLLLAGMAVLALPAATEGRATRSVAPSPKGKARLEAAKRGLALVEVDLGAAGPTNWNQVRVWARRVTEAELALCTSAAERKAAWEAYVRRARDAEQVIQDQYKNHGPFARVEVLEAEFFRADAEALLAEDEIRPAAGG